MLVTDKEISYILFNDVFQLPKCLAVTAVRAPARCVHMLAGGEGTKSLNASSSVIIANKDAVWCHYLRHRHKRQTEVVLKNWWD